MRYQDFIADLRALIDQAQGIVNCGVTHEDQRFRAWRYRAQSLVTEARSHGYRLPGRFDSEKRMYRAIFPGATRGEDSRALDQDVGDSIIELRYLVEQFEKYGVPPTSNSREPATSPSRKELAAPDQVTLSWLFRNVSVKFWSWAAGILVTVFFFGALIGRTGVWDNVQRFAAELRQGSTDGKSAPAPGSDVKQAGLVQSPSQDAAVTVPELPGGSGWILVGDLNPAGAFYVRGPFYTLKSSSYPEPSLVPRKGERLQLSAAREVVIADFKTSGLTLRDKPPWRENRLDDADYTGIKLPAGTVVEVRDVSMGQFKGQPRVVWVRVAEPPG